MASARNNKKKRSAAPSDKQAGLPPPKRQEMNLPPLKEDQALAAEPEQVPAVHPEPTLIVNVEHAPSTGEEEISTSRAKDWGKEPTAEDLAERRAKIERRLYPERDIWDRDWILLEGPEELRMDYAYWQLAVDAWIHKRAITRKEMADLSPSQKSAIVSNLKGILVQEPLDSLMDLVPKPIAVQFPIIFLNAYIVKDVLSKLFDNPFWYFDGENEQLNQVYHKFLQTNRIHAVAWRAHTVRLANAVTDIEGNDVVLGLCHQERRKTAFPRFASDLLSSELFKLLLKPIPPKEKPAKLKELAEIYEKMAGIALKPLAHYGIPYVTWLDSLGDTFPPGHEIITTTPAHCCETWDPRLNGRRLLMVHFPALIMHECR
ncbi:hypothetical protein BDV59DRAFT_204408 [Aspergillus ambiguus]|uniref:uncharacterized protein n=1 Tax=Aspergillus ambiguus TaxID=176160 RepID=UPI003CCE3705